MGEEVEEEVEDVGGPGPEEGGEIEIEVIDEGGDKDDESEEKTNKEKNEELMSEGEPVEDCSKPAKKSALPTTVKEMMEARAAGQNPFSGFLKSTESDDGTYHEFNPWGTNIKSIFKSDLLDDVDTPQVLTTGGNTGNGGEMLDQVDETKGMSDGKSGQGGEKLDEVDTQKPQGKGGNGDDKIDDVNKPGEGHPKQGDAEDKLDEADHEQPTRTATEGKDKLDEVKKSAEMNGKYMPTLKDMIAIKKSGRPDATSSAGGEIGRPSLESIAKSSLPEPVRMGRGVDPKKVVERDLAEYNLYKARKTF